MPGYPRPDTVQPRPLSVLADLLRAPDPDSDAAVTGVTHASGSVRPGDLYAALPGARRHGAEFIAEAAAAGAAAVLTDPAGAPAAAQAGLPVLVVDEPRKQLGAVAAEVYGNPSRRLPVYGITGTAGKTSTAYLMEAGLREVGLLPGLIGTVEARLGDERLESERTTPEAPDLQALLAVAVERGIDAMVMEVSSHALTLGRVSGVQFEVGAFTNLGVDHLDFHADLAEYFAAKAMLFDGRSRHEVVNLDDPAGRKLIHQDTITVSAAGDPAATWRAGRIDQQGYSQRFEVSGPDGVALTVSLHMPGAHNVGNALIALASLEAGGLDPEAVARGLTACPGVPGRMERVKAPGPVLGVVDYAHKPDAVSAVLAALREIAHGKLICVIGAGGDRDRGKRPLMGEAAARGADLLLVTDDNPRNEDPATVRAQVIAGARDVVGGAVVTEVAGRRAAIDEAVRRVEPGDAIAVLGKGHEKGQEVAGEVHPFDDRVELAASLTERFGTR
ncbi:MAG: UDP-N-acetylmuramoyl-L-alanyl-D-glutamate--2,6-diaminopimelate ligase [Micromonosporaceae bacterium]